jgi:hypothetical protein
MDLKFLFYSFLSVVLITGGTFYFFSSGAQTTGAIFFLGSIIATIFFGMRWFSLSGTDSAAPGAWPPAINYCPDFLTLTTVGGEKVCIDMTGVAQKSTLKRSNGTNTGSDYIVKLHTTTPSAAERVKKLCDDAKEKGITWEGVWDGSTCSGVAPPLPP